MLELVEYSDVDLAVWTVLVKKFSKSVCQVVLLAELENRFSNLLTEPYDCLADKFRCPFARAYKPRCFVSCEKAC